MPRTILYILILVLTAPAHAQEPAVPPDLALEVMSFNLRYGTAKDGRDSWVHRRPRVRALIEAESPDLIGTQEGLRFQLDELGTDLPAYGELGRARADGEERGEYSAILYRTDRLEALKGGTFWFSDSPEVPGSTSWGNRLPRICTWARFRDLRTGDAFYLYNAHLDHESPESRRRSAELLAERIQERDPKDPVLVTGDLNAGPASPPVGTLGKVVRDTWTVVHGPEEGGGTFHGFRGGREGERIDYVFAGPAWQVMGVFIIRARYAGGWPSDHYPVTARVRPRPAPGGGEAPDGR